MFKRKRQLKVENTEIAVKNIDGEDYISLTDMVKSKDGDFFVSDWLRNRNTVEFLDVWERLNNPDFNYGESAIIKSKTGLNNFKISVKEWCERTNAIGLKATAGRYGGTYAHKDIAFEFGMTSKEWSEANPERAKRGENIRDSASINELLVLEMLQVQSAELIRDGVNIQTRLETLRQSAQQKLEALAKVDPTKALKKLNNATYLDTGK